MMRNRPRICSRILEWKAAYSCIRGLFADGLCARRLSVVGEVESAVEAGLVRAARLRQAVLQSAFEGKL
jgi:hypothetical protein